MTNSQQSAGPAADNTAKPSEGKRPVDKKAKRLRRDSRSKRRAPKVGTKTNKVLTLLERSEGASLEELRKATGWQPHSVRGFLSGTLKKKMGYRLSSVKRLNGDRAYRVVA